MPLAFVIVPRRFCPPRANGSASSAPSRVKQPQAGWACTGSVGWWVYRVLSHPHPDAPAADAQPKLAARASSRPRRLATTESAKPRSCAFSRNTFPLFTPASFPPARKQKRRAPSSRSTQPAGSGAAAQGTGGRRATPKETFSNFAKTPASARTTQHSSENRRSIAGRACRGAASRGQTRLHPATVAHGRGEVGPQGGGNRATTLDHRAD